VALDCCGNSVVVYLGVSVGGVEWSFFCFALLCWVRNRMMVLLTCIILVIILNAASAATDPTDG